MNSLPTKLAETAHYTAASIAKQSGNEDNYAAALSLFLAVIIAMEKAR
jgi:hypothetical protein